MNSEICRQILASQGDATRLVAVHSPRPVAWQYHYKNAPYHLSIPFFLGQAGEEGEPSNRADFRSGVAENSGYEGVSTRDPMSTFRLSAVTSLRRILLLSPPQASQPTRTKSKMLRTVRQN